MELGYFIAYFVGIVLSCTTTILLMRWRTGTGTLKIDRSNPEKDTYRFYIDDLDQINKKKKLIVKIEHDVDLSQN